MLLFVFTLTVRAEDGAMRTVPTAVLLAVLLIATHVLINCRWSGSPSGWGILSFIDCSTRASG